jgi:ABC-type multidrug transport system fused ATPase/permease subunit
LLNAYLFLSLLFDAVRTRTSWLSEPESASTAVFTAAVGCKVCIFFLEAHSKTNWLPTSPARSLESVSGLFSLCSFSWLNKLIARGYKKIMTPEDLFPLDQQLSAERYAAVFSKSWKDAGLKSRRPRLLWALASALKWRLLQPVLPRIALSAFAFSQPFMINSLLAYLQQDADSGPRHFGYGFIGAAALIYTGMAVSTAFYWYFQQRFLASLRACLTAPVYNAAMRLSITARDTTSVLTLMDSDVSMIQGGLTEVHECWANTVEVAIASWLLYRQLGTAFAAPLVIVVLCAVGSFVVGKLSGITRDVWMKTIQARVGRTSEVVSAMVSIKQSGLVSQVTAAIKRWRGHELRAARQFRLMATYATIAGYAPLLLSPAATFIATGKMLTAQDIFTSLAYIQLLCNPLTHLFQVIPQIFAALTCLERIDRFLEFGTTDPKHSEALHQDDLTDFVPFPASSEESETCHELDTGSVVIEGGEFGWDTHESILHDVNADMPSGKLTMIVGAVGSGKSTLLRGLLGELPLAKGSVKMSGTSIAYCDQEPFIVSESIRANIINHSPLDEPFYKEVLLATALKEDLDSFSRGDLTEVGTNGSSLSGGQRQRLVLARALYARAKIVILDDVLSGLDPRTEEHVFRQALGPGGLLSRLNTTVILATHSRHYLGLADHVVLLDNQTVTNQGHFSDLKSKHAVHTDVLGLDEPRESRHPLLLDSPTKIPADVHEAVTLETSLALNESSARQTGDFDVYKVYFARFGMVSVVVFLLSGLVFAFLYNFGTVWMELWSASIQRGENRRPFYLGIYVLVQTLALLLMGLYVSFFGMVMAVRASRKIHNALLETVMAAPLSFFTSVEAGTTTNYFSQDISAIDNTLSNALSNTVLTALTVLAQAAVMATATPYVLVGFPVLFAIVFVVATVYLRTSRQLRLLEAEAKAPVYTHAMETLKGRSTVRAFGWVAEYIRRHNALLDDSQKPLYLLAMLQQWLTFVLNMTVAALAIGITTLATQLHTSAGFTGVGLVSSHVLWRDDVECCAALYAT